MSATDNKKLVRDYHMAFRAKNCGEEADLARYFSEDVRWHVPRSSHLYGTLEGRAAVLDLLEAGVEDYFQSGSINFDYEAISAEADRVIMQWTMTAMTANGHDYENDYCFVMRIHEGQIAEVWEYLDTAHLYTTLALV